MSKRSLFWGNGTGKLGEAVYYRAGGEQRTRTYVKNVKNPKSRQQALQRTKFNNVVGAYKALSSAVKSFYTTRNANQSPFNAFFRKNWGINNWVASKDITNRNEGVMLGFYVANGDFDFSTDLKVSKATNLQNKYFHVLSINAGSFTTTGGAEQQKSVPDGKAMYELLVGTSNPYNLPAEFNVTVIEVLQGQECQGAMVATMKCSATSTDKFRCIQNGVGWKQPTAAELESLIQVAEGVLSPGELGEPGAYNNVTAISVGKGYESEAAVAAGHAIVISFKDAAGKKCTRSVIAYGQALSETARDYTPIGDAGKAIISQYEVVSSLIE